jgi:hypothetical protein
VAGEELSVLNTCIYVSVFNLGELYIKYTRATSYNAVNLTMVVEHDVIHSPSYLRAEAVGTTLDTNLGIEYWKNAEMFFML